MRDPISIRWRPHFFPCSRLKKPPDSMDRLLQKLEVPTPRTLNPTVPEHVSNAIMKAMSLEAQYRFDDIAQFRAALRGEFSVPTVVSPSYPAQSPTLLSTNYQNPAPKSHFRWRQSWQAE